jgi:hypothetical protein
MSLLFNIDRWFEVPSMSVDFEIWLNTFPTRIVFENSLKDFQRAWFSGSPNPTQVFDLQLALRTMK